MKNVLTDINFRRCSVQFIGTYIWITIIYCIDTRRRGAEIIKKHLYYYIVVGEVLYISKTNSLVKYKLKMLKHSQGRRLRGIQIQFVYYIILYI